MTASEDRRLFWQLTQAYRRAAAVADAGLEDLGLTAAQAGALFAIPPGGAVSVNDIAARLRIAQSAASNFAQKLERAGLVARKADPRDSRYALLALTERGQDLRKAALARAKDYNRRLAGGFSEAEIATVSAWLQHVIAMKDKVEEP